MHLVLRPFRHAAKVERQFRGVLAARPAFRECWEQGPALPAAARARTGRWLGIRYRRCLLLDAVGQLVAAATC